MNSFACGELKQHCPCSRDSAQNVGSGKTGLTRIFHELIWPQMQGAGRDAVINLLRAAYNTADAAKVTRPKGEIFRHTISVKCLNPLMTVCIFINRLIFIVTVCV